MERVSTRAPLLHNIRPQLSLNQPLTPAQAQRGTTLEQIERKLCRMQMTLDFHYEPGDSRAKSLLDAFSTVEEPVDENGDRSQSVALELLPVECVLGNVAAHAGEIMSMRAPGACGFSPIPGMPSVKFRVEPDRSPDEAYGAPGWNTWDQTWINSIHCGNRCGGRSAFLVLCAPYFAEYYRCAAAAFKLEQTEQPGAAYYRGLREKLYTTVGRKVGGMSSEAKRMSTKAKQHYIQEPFRMRRSPW